MDALELVPYSYQRGQAVLAKRSEISRKQAGQFLTPVEVARFMARQPGPIPEGAHILDPAIGSGVLACAVIEAAMSEGQPGEFWIDGYEIDEELCRTATEVLERAKSQAAARGIRVHFCVHCADFISSCLPPLQPTLFSVESTPPVDLKNYDLIIANPPYFKLNVSDPRVQAVAGRLKGHTNIYTLFMALAVQVLSAQGRACFIVPRSFCSGAYFSAFRQDFIRLAQPLAVHLFESRQDTFVADDVLQENVILTFRRRRADDTGSTHAAYLDISTSKNILDLDRTRFSRRISEAHFIYRRNKALFFRLPVTGLDEEIVANIDRWPCSLNQSGLHVSTGPVVAFRAESYLVPGEAVIRAQAVPLLWMQNVKPQRVEWPARNGGNKPQGLLLSPASMALLLPKANYVLLRRFSAKEEPRRLVAAPLLSEHWEYDWVGLENHLNYIYKKQGEFSPEEVIGLSALLNSALVDRYFRILNGNTQVNAEELRALPLPSPEVIRRIGSRLLTPEAQALPADIDRVVFSLLRESGFLPPDFPIFWETRFTMGKIQQAQAILKALGLPLTQQNEIAALTLLVLAGLSEETPWQSAQRQSLRIHDMLAQIKLRYGREYAENTRETIRRQVIHQFEQAGVVLRNPNDPALPTNSPRTHYTLSDAALETIRAFDSPGWENAVHAFVQAQSALVETYRREREQRRIPLRLSSGEVYRLSPGRHNALQAAIVEEFAPRFAPEARLLYIGDTENKALVFDEAAFKALSVLVSVHDKLPDVVIFDEPRSRLLLIEAVTTHGLVSPKRRFELEGMFAGCPAGRVYVSAFPDFNTFKNFITEIAWETEVWIAESPDHLIHFNGDHFLGPQS